MTNLLLLDVSVDPVSPLPWAGLIVLLIIAFVLAVIAVAGLVFFLIWWKRKKINESRVEAPAFEG